MNREEIIGKLADLMAGLAVPVSLGVRLGVAREAWADLHRELVGVGWHLAEDYRVALERTLALEPVTSEPLPTECPLCGQRLVYDEGSSGQLLAVCGGPCPVLGSVVDGSLVLDEWAKQQAEALKRLGS